MRRNRLKMGIYAALLALAALAAGVLGLSVALDRVAQNARNDLELSGDRLAAYLQRYRETAVLLAEHPDLGAAVAAEAAAPGKIDAILQDVADKSGAAGLMLVSRSGRVLSRIGDAPDAGAMPAQLARAFNGALGAGRLVTPAGARLFITAAPIFAASGPAQGALVIAVDAAEIEWNWPNDPNAVFFAEPGGRIFTANRSDLVLAQLPGPAVADFPGGPWARLLGHDLWRLDRGAYLPSRALHLVRPMPVIDLEAGILVNAAPALRAGLLQGLAVLMLGAALGVIGQLAADRRRELALRLSAEEEANQRLEARVRERTAELSALNLSLQREVAERQEAEAALRRAQQELVQAAKLSALGKMSAGISHELNQPLMAIRSFAENAQTLLERGQSAAVAGNLGRISDLARRMGRIIRNLRAFARQENEALTDVDLVAVVEAVLELVAVRLKAEEVTLDWQAPASPVIVRGGEVRLQQVVMNLVSNALDAMQGRPERRLSLSIAASGGRVVLSVRDSGPGIADPDRIFDPFYSTKTVGEGEGMGLGLSISYGLVQSFGGEIRGRNHPEGGAVFAVELTPAGQEAAA